MGLVGVAQRKMWRWRVAGTSGAAAGGVEVGGACVVPLGRPEGFGVSIDEEDVGTLVVAGVGSAPVGVIRGGDAAGAGGVIAGVMDDPAAGLALGGGGDGLLGIPGVGGGDAAVAQVHGAGGVADGFLGDAPDLPGGGPPATAEAEVGGVVAEVPSTG